MKSVRVLIVTCNICPTDQQSIQIHKLNNVRYSTRIKDTMELSKTIGKNNILVYLLDSMDSESTDFARLKKQLLDLEFVSNVHEHALETDDMNRILAAEAKLVGTIFEIVSKSLTAN